MDAETQKQTEFKPKFRYKLKGRIHSAGFRTLSDFARAIGVDVSRISRIVSGWEGPSPKIQRAMADRLGLTVKEFVELL